MNKLGVMEMRPSGAQIQLEEAQGEYLAKIQEWCLKTENQEGDEKKKSFCMFQQVKDFVSTFWCNFGKTSQPASLQHTSWMSLDKIIQPAQLALMVPC